jgi:two-component system, OmpR family, osmolarity sensor histidine kinase EnvZ
MTRKGANTILPKGLYTRSLLIIVVPMVLLQLILALVSMERHWSLTTHRLSAAVARDIGALIDLDQSSPDPSGRSTLIRVARQNLSLGVQFLPNGPLPPPRRTSALELLERVLADELALQIKYPFWLDASSDDARVLIKLPNDVMQIMVPRNRAYAANAHIFLVWMFGASIVLLTVSILFLRNQIRPILQLADAAENLGKGRDVAPFPVRGAREVRRATAAFFAMKDRIERQIEQRTSMLAGVSHDLRTVLTRLRLQIALLPPRPEIADLESDVSEMERMLEGYLAFTKGDAEETATPLDIQAVLAEIKNDTARMGKKVSVSMTGDPEILARPDALKRALTNLVTNACRFGRRVEVKATHSGRELAITIDDDGPGIPSDQRDEVFRPFVRLDHARNLDHPGSGLGLAIARDVARSHGGDIDLSDSPLGGLRARFHIPA